MKILTYTKSTSKYDVVGVVVTKRIGSTECVIAIQKPTAMKNKHKTMTLGVLGD